MENELTQRVSDLEQQMKDALHTLYLHKHLGSDKTQLISSAKIYGGKSDPDATSTTLPRGWTASVNGSTKVYTVTHNLGTTAYAVIAQAIDSNALTYFIPFTSLSANSFTVEFDTTGGTAGKTDWTFVLTLIT